MLTYGQRLNENSADWFARMQRMQRRLIVLCLAASAAGCVALVRWLAS